ncbi:MAG: hypothetical protein IJY18_05535 [Clostridia bacterium]|nr:hypothetical protein [Clostridia bacterium]
MKRSSRFILAFLGLIISVGTPAIVTAAYFPLWQSEGGDKVLSGFALFLILISAIPIFKLLSRVFSTPSAPVVWLLIFIFFLLFSKIAEEVTVIALSGTISNALGAVLFKLSGKGGKEK